MKNNSQFKFKVTGKNIRWADGSPCGHPFTVRFKHKKDMSAWIDSCKHNIEDVKIEEL